MKKTTFAFYRKTMLTMISLGLLLNCSALTFAEENSNTDENQQVQEEILVEQTEVLTEEVAVELQKEETVEQSNKSIQTPKVHFSIYFVAEANGEVTGQTKFDSLVSSDLFSNIVTAIPTPVANEGYEFSGWYWGNSYIGSTSSEVYSYFKRGAALSDLTITAKFKQVETPKVHFSIYFVAETNGELTGQTKFDSLVSSDLFSNIVTAIPTPVANEGYEFSGWYWGNSYIGSTSSEVYSYFKRGAALSDLTITAKFKQATPKFNVTVKFVTEGKGSLTGNVTFDSTTSDLFKDVVATMPTPVAEEGNTFDGWYLNGSLIGTTSQEVYTTLENTKLLESTEIVAKFVENTQAQDPITPPTDTPTTPPTAENPQPEQPVINEPVEPVVNNPGQAQQITPVAPEVQDETILDDATPEVINANNLDTIEEEVTPLALGHDSWSLINLVLTLGIAALAIMMVIGKKTTNDETRKVNKNAKVIGCITAVISIIIFILTQDMSNPMALVDKWTIVMLILGLVQVVTSFINYKVKENNEVESVNC
ncbi:InlB B-repeat-containing protein [Anaerorhabdus furcosa]|uniref:Repeat domain (List_Bact_rpt) n=1 Tax=Anaerorhabdus furcosa TaxID=118967 RepID=A0A1T4K4Z4_9FIRM|nr:InlB B-repeat-containing protein [Anaerorhabdus furcosa]SJZ37476.1 repeat domain (List_Bact_rpt) [Anaerorhabdus furcosa]